MNLLRYSDRDTEKMFNILTTYMKNRSIGSVDDVMNVCILCLMPELDCNKNVSPGLPRCTTRINVT